MKNHLMLAVASVALLAAAPAFAQAYSGGTGTFNGLGSDQSAYPGTLFDTADLTAITGLYTGVGTYNFNNVTFTAGINRNDTGTFTGVLSGLTGTFNGSTFNYSVNYSIGIGTTATGDTITLGGNKFIVDGATVLINPLTLTSNGESSVGTLTVSTGAVPEPATWAMMLLGFGMIGAGLRYRRKATKVSFA